MPTEEPSTALAFIRLRAARTGNHLTRAPGIVALRFRYDSRTCHDAFNALHLASNPPGTELATIRLGDETWLVHRSLQVDLAAALLCLEVEMDMGDLLAQYRPDPSPLS